jgi:hypothetical protein
MIGRSLYVPPARSRARTDLLESANRLERLCSETAGLEKGYTFHKGGWIKTP